MPTYVRTQEIAHDIGARGRFVLRVTSPDVELRATDGTAATVRIKIELRAGSEEEADEIFERMRFHVRQADGILEVTEPRRDDSGIGSIVRLLGIGSARVDDASVDAVLPAGTEIAFEGVSTDLTASGFDGSQQYRTVSGDRVLDRVAGDVRVRDVSGDVSIRAEEPLRLEMNTVSGDISAVAPRFESLRLVTVSGDVELEGEFAAAGQHRVETVSGDLSLGVVDGLTLEVRGLSSDTRVSVPHRSEGSRDRRRYVIGGGEGRLQFSSMSGDASVHPGRRSSAPIPPVPPKPPAAPNPPGAPSPVGADEQLEILRALEAGEIGVDEAAARLAGQKRDA
jgi:Putative adhesin